MGRACSLLSRGSSLAIAILAVGTATAAETAAERPALTLERLASLPSVTGTAPARPVWSPDGRRLAFLWNDRALPFRDVWLAEAASGAIRRITDMGRELPPREPESADPTAALAQQAAARAHPGVTDVVWARDGASLVFCYQGDLFRVTADGGTPERLTRTPGGENSPDFSPDGRFLSYLLEGDLWLFHQKTGERVEATRFGAPPSGRVPGGRYSRPDAEFSSYRWSPDSRRLALYADDRRSVRKVLIPNYLGEETTGNALRRDFPGDNDHLRFIALYDVERGGGA
jgi:dipeptidyl-peptidase-4